MLKRHATKNALARNTAVFSVLVLLLVMSHQSGAADSAGLTKEEIYFNEFQDICAKQLPATLIEVRAKPSQLLYEYGFGLDELTARSTDNGVNTLGRTLGLTESKYAYESKIKTPILTHPEAGLSCARAGIQIEIITGPQTISVASEFKPGTCAYQEIIKHELRHAQANQDVAEKTALALEKRMIEHYGSKIFYGTEQSLQAQFKYEVETNWFEWIEPQVAVVNRLHARIDSKEEYARVGFACNGEISNALNRARIR